MVDAGDDDAGFDAAVPSDDGGYDAGPSMCDLLPSCRAGTMEETDECGRCGVLTRVCNESCVWTEYTCVEDAERCDFWVRPDEGTEWSGYRLRDNAFAPTEPIRAAVPIDGSEDALVITDTMVHRFRLTCDPEASPCWAGSSPIATWFPELAGVVRYASDVPAEYRGDGIEGIDLTTDANDYRYEYEVATGIRRHVGTTPATPPPPDTADRTLSRASYTVLGNAGGWLTATCGSPATVPSSYIATIEATHVYVFAPGPGCGAFHNARYTSFAPFDEPGAPPIHRVAAALHRDALYVFAE